MQKGYGLNAVNYNKYEYGVRVWCFDSQVGSALSFSVISRLLWFSVVLAQINVETSVVVEESKDQSMCYHVRATSFGYISSVCELWPTRLARSAAVALARISPGMQASAAGA